MHAAILTGFASWFAGMNLTANLHVNEAAHLFLCALTHAKPGAVYNAATGHATGKQIADAIAAKHGLQSKSIPVEQAAQIYGPLFGIFLTMTNALDSEKAAREFVRQNWMGKLNFCCYVAGQYSVTPVHLCT